ncbi:MAG: hypothetical protein DRO13_00175 [Thermoprotei archaeon]|nr:MAG: hypothetical protein DRO13_00090 [Thermoprotei archaeon]RLG81818.1 MAG: hypothetical protein DRO13_00175 [Thermoprotei archaeon]
MELYDSLRLLALSLLPSSADLALDFNLGVLDLSREVCKARKPRCEVCVLNSICMKCF